MTSMSRNFGVAFLVTLLTLVAGVARGRADGFNPQPEPPGFGLISVDAGQTVRLNVVCFEHAIGDFPPGPCRDRPIIATTPLPG